MRVPITVGVCLIIACGLVSRNERFWIWADGIGAVPLTKNLPGNAIEMRSVFDNRIKSRFSVGSSVADMLSELGKEGFIQSATVSPPDDEHYASRQDGGNGACAFEATVFWRSDRSNRVRTISGLYNATCL